MRNYIFKNEFTGRVKTVREYRAYDAFQKCKSERGWQLLSVSAE